MEDKKKLSDEQAEQVSGGAECVNQLNNEESADTNAIYGTGLEANPEMVGFYKVPL